jgi:hypothetical protein
MFALIVLVIVAALTPAQKKQQPSPKPLNNQAIEC